MRTLICGSLRLGSSPPLQDNNSDDLAKNGIPATSGTWQGPCLLDMCEYLLHFGIVSLNSKYRQCCGAVLQDDFEEVESGAADALACRLGGGRGSSTLRLVYPGLDLDPYSLNVTFGGKDYSITWHPPSASSFSSVSNFSDSHGKTTIPSDVKGEQTSDRVTNDEGLTLKNAIGRSVHPRVLPSLHKIPNS